MVILLEEESQGSVCCERVRLPLRAHPHWQGSIVEVRWSPTLT